jgi:formyl-CoA transferase
MLIATANDRQWVKLAKVLGLEDLAEDERFATMSGRSANKVALLAELDPVIARWKSDELVAALNAAGVPSGRVNTVPEALASPQVQARGQVGTIQRRDGTEVKFVGFPAQLSATPATYRTAPPRAGEDTREVLSEVLDLSADEIERLLASGAVA